jgi:hypothetical protein
MSTRGEQQRPGPEAAAERACSVFTKRVTLGVGANLRKIREFMRIQAANCRIQV